jgi:hypothetical protein
VYSRGWREGYARDHGLKENRRIVASTGVWRAAAAARPLSAFPGRVLVGLCLTLVLLEVGSRLTCCELLDGEARTHYDVASAQLQVWPPGAPAYRWKPNAVLDGRPFTNNLGFPMEHDVAPTPAEGVQRLIAIGGKDVNAGSARQRVVREFTWEQATRRLIVLLEAPRGAWQRARSAPRPHCGPSSTASPRVPTS